MVAYSSFPRNRRPAATSGVRTAPTAGVRLLAFNVDSGLRIMCVNPALARRRRRGPLIPTSPSLLLAFLPSGGARRASTPWVAFPGRVHGPLRQNSATRLGCRSHVSPAVTRPESVQELARAAVGPHVLDVNIALGNLVAQDQRSSPPPTQAKR